MKKFEYNYEQIPEERLTETLYHAGITGLELVNASPVMRGGNLMWMLFFKREIKELKK